MSGQRERIIRAFAKAPDYEDHARVQRSVAEALAARIAALALPQSPRVLEIGCGTGFLTRALLAADVGGDWTITDIAPEMVERCRASLGDAPSRQFAAMDGEFGTPEGGPFDLICSSLALQWFTDAPAALARMADWLAPGGHCLVTTLGPGSFAEWREAHAAEGLVAGTPEFQPVEDFARLDPAALDVEAHVECHADARAFLRSLKAIGAGTSSPRHRPLPPAALRRVMARFEASGSAVTYEVVTCHLHRAR
ncbi:methyltransferase domain-containing protein [Novosphingobium pentaromativorans]|uniref:Bifunctional biotin synthesis protein BioCD n=1 Tax=Novosphingobium pentaromativorans US6-1 TaxID=1088721 RepID=G6ECZ3_9SPHN|nr:methyltransferase domain-containing protein [Novosphingobium pentaromativorans]AIT79902.1 biotin biosynthesis protein [Novosphingobium pentaromativorans US6-1]EHJ60832.1 bifunctional biotin synthesis protein BioCD [Novosphingobium pentaromativorans US6-1]